MPERRGEGELLRKKNGSEPKYDKRCASGGTANHLNNGPVNPFSRIKDKDQELE